MKSYEELRTAAQVNVLLGAVQDALALQDEEGAMIDVAAVICRASTPTRGMTVLHSFSGEGAQLDDLTTVGLFQEGSHLLLMWPWLEPHDGGLDEP